MDAMATAEALSSAPRIPRAFEQMPDPRRNNSRHKLSDVLSLYSDGMLVVGFSLNRLTRQPTCHLSTGRGNKRRSPPADCVTHPPAFITDCPVGHPLIRLLHFPPPVSEGFLRIFRGFFDGV